MTIALLMGVVSCGGRRSPNHIVEDSNLIASSGPRAGAENDLSLDEATSLRDQLDDGMVAIMVEYASDCDRMADKLEEHWRAHEGQYKTVKRSLGKIPWSARELPADKLRWRLAKADEMIQKMTPASEACALNEKAIAVMRSYF
jgi:hypothetical protein